MSFKGFTFTFKNNPPIRSLNGFYGFNITLGLVGVKITDFRGRGLSNVNVYAENPTSGTPFEGFTDSNGSVYMQLDATTPIIIKKDMLTENVIYNGEVAPIYRIDIPFLD